MGCIGLHFNHPHHHPYLYTHTCFLHHVTNISLYIILCTSYAVQPHLVSPHSTPFEEQPGNYQCPQCRYVTVEVTVDDIIVIINIVVVIHGAHMGGVWVYLCAISCCHILCPPLPFRTIHPHHHHHHHHHHTQCTQASFCQV